MTLDVRIVSMDTNALHTTENAIAAHHEKIRETVHSRYGAFVREINSTDGYVNVYTQDGEVVGKPQLVNCSKDTLDKIYGTSHAAGNLDDTLDHENYTDL